MSHLLIVGFTDKYTADRVMLDLLELEKDFLIDLEDAVVFIKNASGKTRMKPYYALVSNETLGWDFGDKLINAVVESDAEQLKAIGLDDAFLNDFEIMLVPNTSALAILCRKTEPAQLAQKFLPHQGKVLKSTLSKQVEAVIQTVLSI